MVLRGQEPSSRKPPPYPFDDTDLYKVIEGPAYTLSVHPDPKLRREAKRRGWPIQEWR
jgi:hypothetical protein